MKGLDPGIFGLIVLTLLFFNLIGLVGVTVYAREKIDRLLCKCSVVADNKATLGSLGLMGDIVRVGVAGSLLIFPKIYANKTIVDEQQINAFPAKLKAMIVAQWMALVVIMSALLVLSMWMSSSNF
jgi:hypothetical protein